MDALEVSSLDDGDQSQVYVCSMVTNSQSRFVVILVPGYYSDSPYCWSGISFFTRYTSVAKKPHGMVVCLAQSLFWLPRLLLPVVEIFALES